MVHRQVGGKVPPVTVACLHGEVERVGRHWIQLRIMEHQRELLVEVVPKLACEMLTGRDWTPIYDMLERTDASKTAVGAVLTQEEEGIERPIAYASRKLSSAEKRWLSTARTDNARITRWALALQPYKFQIVFRPGKSNTVADFLSRCDSKNSGERREHRTEKPANPPDLTRREPACEVEVITEERLLIEAFLMTPESLLTNTPEGSVCFCREQRPDEAEELRRQLGIESSESLSGGEASCNFTTARTSSKIEKQNKRIQSCFYPVVKVDRNSVVSLSLRSVSSAVSHRLLSRRTEEYLD
ncbi:transmembrane protein 64 isoform B [Alligator mississippiensis]|uniref:Transmembrane protein 64 isoform B n=1 Tax=Alligator mississippiensis TaxID=8496 RepID=A0A151PGQ3_ALLMI|nr:transmembrane protein 64 isoform B [Alligator mississippiensis]